MEEKTTGISKKSAPTANYYLVDYTNMGQESLNGTENLSSNDKVVIFYSENNSSIEFSFFEKIYSSKAEIKLQKVGIPFASLLSSYLGYIMGINPNAEYCIISSNGEFRILKEFWAEKEIEINIYSDIAKNSDSFDFYENDAETAEAEFTSDSEDVEFEEEETAID